jgi:ribonuclease BN (tRNA processing enzyme)
LHDLPRGAFFIGGLAVTADLVCHPDPTVGYRIQDGGASMAYFPDHEPALGATGFPGRPEWIPGFDLMRGVDLLIHDTQYFPDEYAAHIGWGHSTLDQVLALAAAAGVKRLVTFHHDPAHDDDALDRQIVEARQALDVPVEIVPGKEGASFEIGR